MNPFGKTTNISDFIGMFSEDQIKDFSKVAEFLDNKIDEKEFVSMFGEEKVKDLPEIKDDILNKSDDSYKEFKEEYDTYCSKYDLGFNSNDVDMTEQNSQITTNDYSKESGMLDIESKPQSVLDYVKNKKNPISVIDFIENKGVSRKKEEIENEDIYIGESDDNSIIV